MATKKKPTKRRRARLEKTELFRFVGYEPHEGQLEVHLSKAPRRVLGCGVRWGKSTVAALLAPCAQSLGWIVAPDYELSARVLHMVREVILEKFGHRVEEDEPRQHRLVVRNMAGGRSEVRARSADHMASLLGAGLDWVIIDEAARLRPDVWESYVSQRLIDRKGWALLASTPRGPGWYHRLFARGQGEDPAYESWSCPSADNPLLDAEAIEQERERLPEETFLQEFGGRFVGPGIPLCDTCLYPRPPEDCRPVVVFKGEELGRCPACAHYVDREGRALCRKNQTYPSVIYLEGVRREECPDMD